MKIIVKARPRAKTAKVELLTQPTLDFNPHKESTIEYRVSVKEPPENGKANDAIIRALAEHFNISKSSVVLVSGQSSRKKIFDIRLTS